MERQHHGMMAAAAMKRAAERGAVCAAFEASTQHAVEQVFTVYAQPNDTLSAHVEGYVFLTSA